MRGFLLALVVAWPLMWPSDGHAQTLADLSWMRGCWRFERNGEVVTETWIAPSAPVMLGFGLTKRGEDVRFWEQTRIVSDADGVAFIAMPSGRAAVRFAMIGSGARRVVFANPAHDFPQRVEYARRGDALTATVSGAGGEPETYPYQRIRCPAELRP